jgi:ribonuclease BN (tRNA processing enzyme)
VIDVVLLGSGGWMPTGARQTCSTLLRADDHAVLLDAGTGVSHLVENPRLLDGVRNVDVVLTHFHLDHVVGLAYLPALGLSEPPHLHGPGQWLYGRPTREILEGLIGDPFFALDLASVVSDVEEIGETGRSLGRFEMAVRAQARHDAPTVALRFDDLLTYCTDTAYDEGNADFARGSQILAHEAWCTEAAPSARTTHTSAREAAMIAAQAAVGSLALIHIQPGFSTELLAAEARSTFLPVVVGEDLLALTPPQPGR